MVPCQLQKFDRRYVAIHRIFRCSKLSTVIVVGIDEWSYVSAETIAVIDTILRRIRARNGLSH